MEKFTGYANQWGGARLVVQGSHGEVAQLLQGVGEVGVRLCDLGVQQNAKVVALHALLVLPQVVVCCAHEQQVVGAVGVHSLNLHSQQQAALGGHSSV